MFQTDLMVFKLQLGSYCFGSSAKLSFTAMQVEAWLKSNFRSPVQIYDDFDVFQGHICIILSEIYKILVIIYVGKLPAIDE